MSERGVWVFDRTTQQLVPKHLYVRPEPARSGLPAPMLIRDSMEPTWNPANGQRYDSKRAYEKAVRAAGCEIVGNENPTRPRKEVQTVTEAEVAAVINQVQAKQAPRKRRPKSGR